MFTRVKPSIIFSIWLVLVVLMYSNCKMFIIRLWDSHSRDPGQGRLPLTFSQLFSPPSMSMSQVSPQFAADKESNVSIPALFSCPHVCLDQSEARIQVTWSGPTNQKPDSGLCNYSPNVCLIQFVLTPALRGTSGLGHSTSVQCSPCHQVTSGWFMASMIRLMRQLELWFSHGFPRQNLNPLELVFIFCDHNNILGNKCFLNVITDNEASRAHFYLQFP